MTGTRRVMLDEVTMQDIMRALRSCYGDLGNPEFGKIAAVLDRAPYRHLIDDLRASGATVTETTDPNDDVSTQLVVSGAGDMVAVELSAVGPFGVVRQLGADGTSRWVSKQHRAATDFARRVADAVQRTGIRLLDREAAVTRIPMRLDDGGTDATLYQALFTNTDRIP